MLHVLPAVIAILVTWSIMGSVLIGVGLALQRLWCSGGSEAEDPVGSFWIGLSAALAVAQVWNLWLPATGWMWVAMAPLAAAGFFTTRWPLIRASLRRGASRPFAVLATVVAVALAIRIAVLAAGAVQIYDTGTYHLPAAMWAHAFPVVPGLANLHSRLGFNSSLFAFAASVAEGPWSGRPHHVVIGLPILMTFLGALRAASRISETARTKLSDLLALSFVAPAIYFTNWGNYPASLGTNCATALLILAGARFALRALADYDPGSPRALNCSAAATVVLCAAATVKITSAPFAALTIVLLLLRHRFARGPGERKGARLRRVSLIAGIVLLLAVPWLIRSTVLSGYPLYPSSVFPAPVDWRVPAEQAQIEAQWTRDFSRGSWDQPARELSWVGRWIRLVVWRHAGAVTLPLLITVAALLLLVRRLRHRDSPEKSLDLRAGIQMAGCAMAAVVVWFVTAPDPRFAAGLLWLLAGLTTALTMKILLPRTPSLLVIVPAGVLILMLGEVVRTPFDWSRQARAIHAGRTTDRERFVLDSGLAPLPSPMLEDFTTRSGLVVKVPARGARIWAAPLLSTPHPSEYLQRRDPNRLGRGFICAGPWRARGYPNPHFAYRHHVEKQLRTE